MIGLLLAAVVLGVGVVLVWWLSDQLVVGWSLAQAGYWDNPQSSSSKRELMLIDAAVAGTAHRVLSRGQALSSHKKRRKKKLHWSQSVPMKFDFQSSEPATNQIEKKKYYRIFLSRIYLLALTIFNIDLDLFFLYPSRTQIFFG